MSLFKTLYKNYPHERSSTDFYFHLHNNLGDDKNEQNYIFI